MGEAVEHLAGQGSVRVDAVVAPRLAEAVVVGDEDEGAFGVDGTHGVDELQVVAAEGCGVEVGGYGVVDADAEDYNVGMQQAQVAHEVPAAQVVGH